MFDRKLLLFVFIFFNIISFNSYSWSLLNYIQPGSEFYREYKISCSRDIHKTSDKLLAPDYPQRPYNVLSYDLYLDWKNTLSIEKYTIDGVAIVDSVDRIWQGRNVIYLVVDSADVNKIELDARMLKILKIIVNSKEVTPTPQPISGLLTVPLGFTANVDQKITISIDYQFQLNEDRGFYLYPKKRFNGVIPNTNDTAWVEERLAYTMSEPEDARFWMPCNDRPNDKATAKITVKVPEKFTVASNGKLTRIENKSDSSRIFYWEENLPISTYLMSVTSSVYKEYSDWYRKVTNPSDSIEIKYYIWQKDYDSEKTDQTEYNARYSFKNTVKMMEVFSNEFIEYPFVKYGMSSVQPFSFGGMEHQTITTINRAWIRTNDHFGIAHELAHQWLGDLITCATWKDIWINEGGASWSEAIWAKALWGIDGYNSILNSKRFAYLRYGGLTLPPIYNPPGNQLFSYPTTYAKSSWVYHLLKNLMGDSLYSVALKSLLTDLAYTSITTDDLMKYLEINFPETPIPYSTFFNQWVYGAGHPVYNIMSSISKNSNKGYDVDIYLAQIQEGSKVSEVFTTPVKLNFYKADSIVDYRIVINNSRLQAFNFNLDYPPDSVSIDTVFTLCEINSTITSVKEILISNSKLHVVYPNPIQNGDLVKIGYSLENNNKCSIDLFDFLGKPVKSIYSGYLNKGNYEFEFSSLGLPNGVYTIKIYNGDNLSFFKLIINR